MTNSTGLRRRQRWATRENRRRDTDHLHRYERWQRVDDVLDRWLAMARAMTRGVTGAEPEEFPPPGFVPRSGEPLLGRFPGVVLVEAHRSPGAFSVGYTRRFSALGEAESAATGGVTRPSPAAADERLVGYGDLIVTGNRVVFHGASMREWAFGALVGMEHAVARPLTFVHVSSRKRVSGFAAHCEQAPQLRFLLTLALACFREGVPDFVGALESARSRHRAAQPVPPAPARPDQAPAGSAAVVAAVRRVSMGRPGKLAGRRPARLSPPNAGRPGAG